MRTRRSRIVLIRHGRSAHVHRGGWISAAGMHQWHLEYDAAGLAAGDAPHATLAAIASGASWLVASDLPRAVVSAERLAPGRTVHLSPLLRETPLAIPGWWPLRWPLSMWAVVIHLQWGYRIIRGTDAAPTELARASEAAAWLAGLADDGSTVVAVTHGVFRRLLTGRLVAGGWTVAGGAHGYGHWSAWDLARDEGVRPYPGDDDPPT